MKEWNTQSMKTQNITLLCNTKQAQFIKIKQKYFPVRWYTICIAYCIHSNIFSQVIFSPDFYKFQAMREMFQSHSCRSTHQALKFINIFAKFHINTCSSKSDKESAKIKQAQKIVPHKVIIPPVSCSLSELSIKQVSITNIFF